MRLIIPCAGDGTRWQNYRGVPKHLAPLCGEPILHRHVRLAREIVPDLDVKVVVPDMTDRRYLVDGSSRSRAKLDPGNGEIDKLVSSAHLWDPRDVTVVAWGDVWWSRAGLTAVLTADLDDDGWRAFLRFGPSGYGGELFAFAFAPEAHDRVLEACGYVASLHRSGAMGTIRGGWALYRTLAGAPVDQHADYGHSTIVDDWTEDMDEPRDWDGWCWRYAHTDPETRDRLVR